MITIRKSADRGHVKHGWLDSRFSFSFADYHDPEHMGFGPLRVINEDYIAAGQGFPMHPHRDMEIISYILEGAIEHRDSMGNGAVLRPGEVQRISAAKGILHSEFNPLPDQAAHMLQIWLLPDSRGGEPSYDQREFPEEQRDGKLCLVASKDGRNGSIPVRQDANLYATTLDGTSVKLPTAPDRKVWVQVARGAVDVNGTPLTTGDAAAITGEQAVTLTGHGAELLVFEMAG